MRIYDVLDIDDEIVIDDQPNIVIVVEHGLDAMTITTSGEDDQEEDEGESNDEKLFQGSFSFLRNNRVITR